MGYHGNTEVVRIGIQGQTRTAATKAGTTTTLPGVYAAIDRAARREEVLPPMRLV
jgi:hypothetical protein